MLQPYITHRWRIVTAALFLVIIVKIYLQNRLTTLSHLHISDKYILRYSATAWISLYSDNAVKILRVHVAILHKDISDPRSNFRTYDHSPMTVLHFTVSNDYVFRWPSVSPAVLVTSALYGYAVVASMEITSLYQHAVAALRVAAVAIRSLVPYFHIAYRQILTEERMDNPERRAQQGDALYDHVLPANYIYKLRTQSTALTEDTVLQRRLFRDHVKQLVACPGILTVLQSFLISQAVHTRHEPPALVGSPTVDSALSGYTHILNILAIDTR